MRIKMEPWRSDETYLYVGLCVCT